MYVYLSIPGENKQRVDARQFVFSFLSRDEAVVCAPQVLNFLGKSGQDIGKRVVGVLPKSVIIIILNPLLLQDHSSARRLTPYL